MNVWKTQESARMVTALIQTARSAVNAPSATTWITPESTVLVRWFLILNLTICNIRIIRDTLSVLRIHTETAAIEHIEKSMTFIPLSQNIRSKSYDAIFVLPVAAFTKLLTSAFKFIGKIKNVSLALIACAAFTPLFSRHRRVLNRKPVWKWNLHQRGGRLRVFVPGWLRTRIHDDLWRSVIYTVTHRHR